MAEVIFVVCLVASCSLIAFVAGRAVEATWNVKQAERRLAEAILLQEEAEAALAALSEEQEG